MAKLLITGASGGIGRHLCRLLSSRHEVFPLSRQPAKDSVLQPCDLVRSLPQTSERAGAAEFDWIVHLATTYRVDEDLAMMDHLIRFARENEVKNFLYVSSWVVHFPRRVLGASYIEMKRRCEARLLESGLENVRIVRPSVVLGEGLSWSRVLQRLAPFSILIPPGFSRSFVSVDVVCRDVEDLIDGTTKSKVVTSLGTRQSLADKAREYRRSGLNFPLWIVFVVTLMVIMLLAAGLPHEHLPVLALGLTVGAMVLAGMRFALPSFLGAVSDYFAGFHCVRFEPGTEQDVVALCHRRNQNIQLRGYDNARLYFQRPNSPVHTTVCLKQFGRVLEIDSNQNLVHVESGVHFGQLLPTLESRGLWLDNYPNYHFISVGACIATAVHGSNLEKPFLADLVESIRLYDRDRDEVVELNRGDDGFSDLVFRQQCPPSRVILSVVLRTCRRQYYELTTRQRDVAGLDFGSLSEIAGDSEHYEIRINSPMSRRAVLQSYRQLQADHDRPADEQGLLSIKADSIGRRWNLLQRNAFCSAVSSSFSKWFINYEWFFSPQEFSTFWEEIRRDRSRYRLYKLLVRYNRIQPDINTSYHGTVSIDVTIFNTRRMLDVSAELFRRYRPTEHHGKFSIERYIDQLQ